MANYTLSGYIPPAGIGSRDDVRGLQQELNAYGAGLSADGIWGPKTQAAYQNYQQQAAQQNQVKSIMGGMQVPSVNVGAAYDAAAAQYKAALDAAQAQSKAELTAQGEALGQQYNDVRNQSYVNSRLSAIGNNEGLSSMGLAGNLYNTPTSGMSETSRIQENIGLRNNLNAATRQENAERDEIALEILKSGYTKDYEYARWMADMQLQKVAAEADAAQNAFRNQMSLAQMQLGQMDGGISLGNFSSGSSGGRSTSKSSNNNSGWLASSVNSLKPSYANAGWKLPDLDSLRFSAAYENSRGIY